MTTRNTFTTAKQINDPPIILTTTVGVPESSNTSTKSKSK